MKKLKLKKEYVCSLTNIELLNVYGGWTTSIGGCTQTVGTLHPACCGVTATDQNTSWLGCNTEPQQNEVGEN